MEKEELAIPAGTLASIELSAESSHSSFFMRHSNGGCAIAIHGSLGIATETWGTADAMLQTAALGNTESGS